MNHWIIILEIKEIDCGKVDQKNNAIWRFIPLHVLQSARRCSNDRFVEGKRPRYHPPCMVSFLKRLLILAMAVYMQK